MKKILIIYYISFGSVCDIISSVTCWIIETFLRLKLKEKLYVLFFNEFCFKIVFTHDIRYTYKRTGAN